MTMKSFGGALRHKFNKVEQVKFVEFRINPDDVSALQVGDIVCMTDSSKGAYKQNYQIAYMDSKGNLKCIESNDSPHAYAQLLYPECNKCKECEPWQIKLLETLCDNVDHICKCCVKLQSGWYHPFGWDRVKTGARLHSPYTSPDFDLGRLIVFIKESRNGKSE